MRGSDLSIQLVQLASFIAAILAPAAAGDAWLGWDKLGHFLGCGLVTVIAWICLGGGGLAPPRWFPQTSLSSQHFRLLLAFLCGAGVGLLKEWGDYAEVSYTLGGGGRRRQQACTSSTAVPLAMAQLLFVEDSPVRDLKPKRQRCWPKLAQKSREAQQSMQQQQQRGRGAWHLGILANDHVPARYPAAALWPVADQSN